MLLIKAILFENSKHLGFPVSDGSLAKVPEQIRQACEKTVWQWDLLGIGSSDSIFTVPLQLLVSVPPSHGENSIFHGFNGRKNRRTLDTPF